MELFEMAWGLIVIGIGLIGADYLLIRRSTNRVVDTLLKRPALHELNRLLNDPRMAQLAVKVIDIIECSHHFLTSLPKSSDFLPAFWDGGSEKAEGVKPDG